MSTWAACSADSHAGRLGRRAAALAARAAGLHRCVRRRGPADRIFQPAPLSPDRGRAHGAGALCATGLRRTHRDSGRDAGGPIIAPPTQTWCCWYAYNIEERSGKNGWRSVQSATSDDLFLLRDGTGQCVIDPEGAEVDSTHRRTWFGNLSSLGVPGMHRLERDFGVGLKVASKVLNYSGAFLEQGYRYTERVILEGEPLYAIGRFHSLDDSDFSESERARMGELLREWKAHPETLRERFDRNRDGVIDQQEWEQARAAARKQAKEELAEARKNTHVHVLRKPRGRIFLIANREQPKLIRRLRWRAMAGFSFFGLALLIDAIALAGRHLG